MASFPEEPLNLSGADGFGYFPANINQALNGGTYHVVRKLGWGTRSSTWLVRQTKDDGVIYWAAQIFTVAASKGVEEGLLPVLQNRVFSKNSQLSFPNLRDHFWVKSVRGEHLCLIVEPYGLPIVGLLHDAIRNGQAGLPVHAAQYSTSVVLEVLETLHSGKIMHGGVIAENVIFAPATQSEWLQPVLDANLPAETVYVDGLPVVRSQPLDNYKPEWNEPMRDVADWMLDLVGYGHAQSSPYESEPDHDYCSAPETLLTNATCGPQTDIWMLGCLVFQILTGRQLLTSTGTSAERLAEIRDVLQDTIPDAWLDDENLQALPPVNPSTQTLQQTLNDALANADASAAYAFLGKCLVMDPQGRTRARDLHDGEWVEEGAKCSCCYN